MATIRSYTTVEQSRVLAGFLPLNSADMGWNVFVDDTTRILPINDWDLVKDGSGNVKFYHAWSLAVLLDILPDEITDNGDVYRNMFFHLKGKYIIQYPRLTTLWPSLLSVEADNPIDACYEMILKSHELKML